MDGFSENVDLYGQLMLEAKFTSTNLDIDILGIDKGASKGEIKKAYHKVPLVFQFTFRPR